MDLSAFGWDTGFEDSFQVFRKLGLLPARIIEPNRLFYRLISEKGEVNGKLSGKFIHDCHTKADYPTAGDWVAIKPGILKGFVSIQGMVSRRSRFSRKVKGKASAEQVIAANIDTIFVVSGLDRDFNLRRLERYIALAADSKAELVFILNKADLCEDLRKVASEVEGLLKDAKVYVLSALNNEGMAQLTPHLKAGKTVVFLGSSGAGKSTIINRLLGEERQKTGDVSAHGGRGRHITTSRSLILLPSGAVVIDTPGLRELQLLCGDEGLKSAFSDIEVCASDCRYKTCTHTNEQGCAVLSAVAEGRITEGRLKNYHKLKREIAYNISRNDGQSRNRQGKGWKKVSRRSRLIKKDKGNIQEDWLGSVDY